MDFLQTADVEERWTSKSVGFCPYEITSMKSPRALSIPEMQYAVTNVR